MNKMNKKGFTLIEMLVVIAIIAVLVSIIIPVVSNSTIKAQAATNAANLRSMKAEIVTKILTNDMGTYTTKADFADSYESNPGNVKFYNCYDVENAGLDISVDGDGDVTIKYANMSIQDWADKAAS